MTATEVYYDPYDYAIDVDPYPVWRRLRDEAPLYHNERVGFYALSRYDDVLAGLLNHESFVSSHGILLEMMGDEPLDVPLMIMMDPPAHTRLRGLVSRAFTPRRIAELEDRITARCAQFLDPLVGQDQFDYISAFAGLLPPTVILELLGFPEGHAAEFQKIVDDSLHVDEGPPPTDFHLPTPFELIQENMELGSEIYAMLPDLLEQRKNDPHDDLMSALVHAEIVDDDGELRSLTQGEIIAFVQLIGSAGTETVARLLGFGAVTLAHFPDQRALLVEDPTLIGNAVEELLRYEAPSPVQFRWVARDVELHGTKMERGSKIALLNGSADRDERHFSDPDQFDVRREIDRHLAFGYGAHFCIGAALARLEGRIGLTETLRRFPTWEVDATALERVHTSTVRGYSKLPMIVG